MTNVSTNFRMHNIVSIQPRVREFSDFTLYTWIVTDKHGVSTEMEFFHSHCDTLVIHPKRFENIAEKEKAQCA